MEGNGRVSVGVVLNSVQTNSICRPDNKCKTGNKSGCGNSPPLAKATPLDPQHQIYVLHHIRCCGSKGVALARLDRGL